MYSVNLMNKRVQNIILVVFLTVMMLAPGSSCFKFLVSKGQEVCIYEYLPKNQVDVRLTTGTGHPDYH